MAFFKDIFYAKHFALLLAINSIFIALAQFYNLPKLFDSHWWYCLIFRESMLFCTYFLAFCLVYYLPIKPIFKKSFVIFVSVISVILLIVNIFLALNFSGTLNEHLIGIALQSDPNEVKEFLGEYVSVKFCVVTIVILAMLGIVYRYASFIQMRFIDNAKMQTGGGQQLKRRKIFWVIFSVLLILLIIVHIARIRPYNQRESDVIYVAITSTKYALKSILEAMKEYEQINKDFDKYAYAIPHTKASQDMQVANIVLIIGESAQRNLMQIYGYYLSNTPIISEIYSKHKDNIFIFNDVISSQVTTFQSLSQVLTFANQDNLNKQWYEYLNIIDAMKLGGYKSIVISNQERFSLWSKATTTIFSRADKLIWSEDSIAGKRLDTMGFDGNILPLLDNEIKNVESNQKDKNKVEKSTKQISSLSNLSQINAQQNNAQPLFLSLHLMGSHLNYSNRYPKDFEIFAPKDIKHKNARAKADLAQYANSILYTDFILGEIIKRFCAKDSIIIYISDHANDVWDTREGSSRLDNKITPFMVEVPFIIFVSDTFKTLHPQLYTRIKNSTNKPFMLDDLIHALIDIGGFHIEGYESARSLFSENFNENRPRMLGTKAMINYDKELKK